ncbi:co-chaperone YbbN [Brevibacterium litoralis]|uniref:co-chaperone YbbN n=1 Tax=Brevibacterium litoralis TaxID=3138935 RepID=UPI0032EF569A
MTVPPSPQDPQAAAPQGLDLSAARSVATEQAPASAAGAPAGGAAAGGVPVPSLVFEADEQTFNDVVALSEQVPVVVHLASDKSPESTQLGESMATLVRAEGGALVLVRLDVEANPRVAQALAQAFQAQVVPTVGALVKSQPVPLFQNAVPEGQIKDLFGQLKQLAAQNGVTGTAVAQDGGDQAPAEDPVAHPEAIAAMEAGDLDGAAEIYRRALKENPGDDDARVGLARVGLLGRVKDLDLQQVRDAAARDTKDVDAALDMADLDVAGGFVADAFARLLTVIRLVAGDDRERVRVRLLELFEVVGVQDPRVVKARGQLMRALF